MKTAVHEYRGITCIFPVGMGREQVEHEIDLILKRKDYLPNETIYSSEGKKWTIELHKNKHPLFERDIDVETDMFDEVEKTDVEMLADKHDMSVQELEDMIQSDMFDNNPMTDDEMYNHNNVKPEKLASEEPKKKRERKAKNPLNALLPMVFNAKGNVRRHPTNPKVKTADIRDTIRKAAKISNMSSVMVVIPSGVLHLGTGFYDLCYGPTGAPIFDLIIEDMMLQGWIVRGVDFKSDATLHTPSVVTIDKDE